MPFPDLPPPPKPGEPLRASDAAQTLAAIAANRPVAGRGLKTTPSANGTVISLAEPPTEYRVGARIGAVYGNDGDPVDTIRYDAQALGAEGVSLVEATPKYGRLFADTVACKPAAVGDFCFIVRMPLPSGGFSAALWVVSEQYYVVRCVSSGGTGGTGARRPLTGPGGTPLTTVPPPPPPPGSDGSVIVDSGRDPMGGFGEF